MGSNGVFQVINMQKSPISLEKYRKQSKSQENDIKDKPILDIEKLVILSTNIN